MLTERQRRTVHKSPVTIAMVYIFIAKTNLRAGPKPAQPQGSGAEALSRMKIPLFSTVSTRNALPSVQPRLPVTPIWALTVTRACIMRRVLTVVPRLLTFCLRLFTYWPWSTDHLNTPQLDAMRCKVASQATVGHYDPVPSVWFLPIRAWAVSPLGG